MKVAILDSGVSLGHPHIGNVVGGISISPIGTSPDYLDWLGHGTAVAAAIHEKAPDADLFIVKIFGRQLSATITQLVMGLEWALDQGVDLINLSLGTQNESHCVRLAPSIERSLRLGSRIVSARCIGDSPCYPGSMPGVLGVESDVSIPREKFYYSSPDVAIASPYPRPIPGVPPEKNLQGISFAVANVTGLLCSRTS